MTFLPTGRSAGHPADLLGSYHMANFLQEAGQHFKHVLLDVPPLLTSIDARAASGSVDGFILVAEWARTRRRDLHRGLEASGPVRGKLIGTVLNKCNLSKMAKFE
jgi:Mrp family chromosome partitioning ATPase